MLAVVASLLASPLSGRIQAQAPNAWETRLATRVSQNPDDASAWRLLGRLRLQRMDIAGALEACREAVRLSPHSVSAHFDLAQACLAANSSQEAREHLEFVREVAPESDYGRTASEQLASSVFSPPPFVQVSAISAERSPNRFAGAPLVTTLEPPVASPFAFRLDIGAQFNSNVQLAPLSRVIVSQPERSAQGFLSPEFEWVFGNNGPVRSGAAFQGYFSVNEAAYSGYDLQNYQPGWFLERVVDHGEEVWVYRGQYDFLLDEFQGNTYARRHALTALLSIYRPESESFVYWTTDHSNFADDGADPSLSSLDGWTHTAGASHTMYVDAPLMPRLSSVRGGLDLQWAALEGADFAYQGVFLYTEAEHALALDFILVTQLGWGYRDYPDFTGAPSRNENLWRASAELRRQLGSHWEISGFFNYDRFATANASYDASRAITGLMTTYRR